MVQYELEVTSVLNSIFDPILTGTEGSTLSGVSPTQFFMCIFTALFTGFIIAGFYTFRTKYTKSFIMTLSTLPAAVAMVILMVNGSVGTGVAVAGAFSLIRFRSVPGTAKEISAIFLAMGAGLAFGLGYLAFGISFSILISVVNMGFTISPFGEVSKAHRTLTVTIPEHLDYQEVFDEPFEEYTLSNQLISVKSTSMGSLFKLVYDIELANNVSEKEFLDEVRCRNGNLEITMTKQNMSASEHL